MQKLWNTPSGRYRLQSWLITASSAVVITSLFFLLHTIIPVPDQSPVEAARRENLITVLFIVLSVLILFPAREYFLRRIFKRQDWETLIDEDIHHLDFLARQFSVDSLLHQIIPDLLFWLRVSSARIALLSEDRRSYRFHIYKNGKIIKGNAIYYQKTEELKREFKAYRKIACIDDEDLPEGLKDIMQQNRVAWIIPFIFRTRLLGFLFLMEPPRNRYADRALQLFAGKAAVSIQNHILSSKIIDAGEFEKELQSAEKIHSLMKNSRVPAYPGFQLQPHQDASGSSVQEFFTVDDGLFLVIFATQRGGGVSGLLLSGLLGHLYSLVHVERDLSIHRILGHMRKENSLLRMEPGVEMLIAQFHAGGSMTVFVEGKQFRFQDTTQPDRILISPGWRNYVDLTPGILYRIEHNNQILLDIRANSNPAAEAIQ
ncbi:MAG: hypothetical protein KDK23_07750 [Leptospiraceae bacterium]|nr:hypothetical protein [Leptospiraceae bacterium]